jgi:hypothetical protein
VENPHDAADYSGKKQSQPPQDGGGVTNNIQKSPLLLDEKLLFR